MSSKERGEKLEELRAELLREHGVKAAGGAPKNPGRIRALRKAIARILTIEAAARGAETKPPKAPAAQVAKPAPARRAAKSAPPKRGAPAGARKAAGTTRRKA